MPDEKALLKKLVATVNQGNSQQPKEETKQEEPANKPDDVYQQIPLGEPIKPANNAAKNPQS